MKHSATSLVAFAVVEMLYTTVNNQGGIVMSDEASTSPAASVEPRLPRLLGRRTFLQIGGFAVAAVAAGPVVARPAAAGNGAAPGSRSASVSPSAAASSTLRIGLPSYPASWDQDFVGFDLVALSLYKNTYPYMVDYGVTEIEGARVLDTTNIVPSMAESWTPDDEGRVWTLVLKEGLVFPSGNPLTAEDVKWSKDRAFAAQANVAGVYRLIGLTAAEQVEVVDERTVRFTQEFPSPLSPQIQAISMYVFDSKLAQENAAADDEWAQEWMSTTPVSGGRFNVESAEPGQAIVLVANPDFAGTDPAFVSRIEMPIIDNVGTRRVQLESGDIDIALGLTRQDIADLSSAEGITIISSPSNVLVKIDMQTTAAPFDDVNVRKAFAYAVPYEQVIANVYGGDARRANSPIPLDMPGNSATGFPYDTNLDAAAEALAAAGLEEVEAELVYAAGDVEQEQIAVLVASAVADAGFTLTPTPLDPATLVERRAAKTIPLQITAGQFWVDDVEYVLSTSLTDGAFLNYAGYINPEIDQIFADSHTITDEAERLALWERVQEILAEDVPQAVICQPSFNLPVRDSVSGWVQPVDGLFRLQYLEVE
jgi:peptide/nickel transport system substrate-binding protein